MLLQAALANAVLGTTGTVDAVGSAWNRALELADELDDIDQRLRALYGLYTYQVRIGEYRKGLAFARRFCTAAEKKSDPSDLLLRNRIVGVSLFYLGDPGQARAKVEQMLAGFPALRPRLQAVRFGLDQKMAALVHLSRILWVQGYPDQAVRTAASGVDEAAAIDHTVSLCFALADGACEVSAWVGDGARRRALSACCPRGRRSSVSRSGTPMASHGEAGSPIGRAIPQLLLRCLMLRSGNFARPSSTCISQHSAASLPKSWRALGVLRTASRRLAMRSRGRSCRGAMVLSRTVAHSGRRYAAPERSGRDPACDGSLHAGARLGAPSRSLVLGTPNGREPRAAMEGLRSR
jgi:hypothetical protein